MHFFVKICILFLHSLSKKNTRVYVRSILIMYISLIIKEILIYFLFTIVNKKPRNNKIISPQI